MTGRPPLSPDRTIPAAADRPLSLERVELESDAVSVTIIPALGGRVVSLADRRSGRDWLVQGRLPDDPGGLRSWAEREAIFSGERAFGWDECLPTIAPCPDPLDPDGPPLRDHGDGWGRPTNADPSASLADRPADSCRLTWTVPGRYRFERLLSLAGPVIRVDYRLASLGPDLPFLWAMHPLLALDVGARLTLPGVDQLTAAQTIGLDLVAGGQLDWPHAARSGGGTVDLATIPGVAAAVALKGSVEITSGPVSATQPDGAAIVIDWDREAAPALGIWIDAGGWPAGERRHQVALEPTTAPFDDLAGSLAAGRAGRVRPGREVRWWATVTLSAPDRVPSEGAAR